MTQSSPSHSVVPRSFGTHDGTFHADEVTACALLHFFNMIDKDKVHRTREPEVLQQCEYVCDVGGIYDPQQKRFDHHQLEYKGLFSSAGMILEYLKTTNVISAADYDFLNNSLIRGVDAHDNGREMAAPGLSTFSHIISNFHPIEYNSEPDAQTAAFHRAEEFAFGHIQRLWDRYKYTQSCRATVVKTMAECRDCLVFDTPVPWMDTFFEQDGAHHPARFVIMPVGKHWKLRGIPPTSDEKMKVRQPMPEEWAGLLDNELKKVSNIEGAVFCHKGRFISVWETKEASFQALQKLLELGISKK